MSSQMWRAVAVYRIVTLCYAAVVIISNDSHYAHPAGGYLALAGDDRLDRPSRSSPTRGRGTGSRGCRHRRRGGDDTDHQHPVDRHRRAHRARRADDPGHLGRVGDPRRGGAGRAVGRDGRRAAGLDRRPRSSGRRCRRRAPSTGWCCCWSSAASAGTWSGSACGPRPRPTARPARRPRSPSGNGSRAASMTPSCRCSRWSAAAAKRSAGRRPSSARWPPSKRRRCARWCRVTAPSRTPRLGSWMCAASSSRSRTPGSRCPARRPRSCCPPGAARALSGAAVAAIDNVRRHAGDGARGWVLVEDDGTAIRVSVRDDGTGFGPGRLAAGGGSRPARRVALDRRQAARRRREPPTVTSRPGQGTEVDLRVPHPR